MRWNERFGYGPRVEIPKAKAIDLRRKVKQLTKRNSVTVNLGAKLQELNPILRGWANYYRYCAYAGRVFSSLDWYIRDRMWRWSRMKRPKAGVCDMRDRYCPVASARQGGSGRKGRSSNICSRGRTSADTASHGWKSLVLPCLLESRMRNERRMSGSVRGDEKPAAERRFGARRLLYTAGTPRWARKPLASRASIFAPSARTAIYGASRISRRSPFVTRNMPPRVSPMKRGQR